MPYVYAYCEFFCATKIIISCDHFDTIATALRKHSHAVCGALQRFLVGFPKVGFLFLYATFVVVFLGPLLSIITFLAFSITEDSARPELLSAIILLDFGADDFTTSFPHTREALHFAIILVSGNTTTRLFC